MTHIKLVFLGTLLSFHGLMAHGVAKQTSTCPIAIARYIWDDAKCKELDNLPNNLSGKHKEITRKIPVQIWYPANIRDLAKLPVILFSHGIRENITSNSAQCENLARHGYVVVSVGHPSTNRSVKLGKHKVVRSCVAQEKVDWDSETEIWLRDVNVVLENLISLNMHDKHDRFYKKLDLERIGIFGFSLGGGLATQMCHDRRIKACVNLDGGLFARDTPVGVTKPFMYMTGRAYKNNKHKHWSEQYIVSFKSFLRACKNDTYLVCIDGADHASFCDRSLLRANSMSWMRKLYECVKNWCWGTRVIDAHKANEIINFYIVNFFDIYLKGERRSLIDFNRNKYSEVAWEKMA